MSNQVEEELCPEAKEFLEWYDREAVPRVRKFVAHFVNCLTCQRNILSIRDGMAFDMFSISDEEIIKTMREALEEEEGSV